MLKLIFSILNKNWSKKCDTRWYLSLALKTNLDSLNTEADKIDIDKLAPVPIDLSKLSDVVKKVVYEKLAAKVNNIDTSKFVLKTKYQTDKAELEKKIPDVTNFVKITELENKIPDVNSLATKTAYLMLVV